MPKQYGPTEPHALRIDIVGWTSGGRGPEATMNHLIPAGGLLHPARPTNAPTTPHPDQPAPPALTTESLEEIPFTLSAGKIFLDIMVNGKGPYPFAMDTGSPPTVIDIGLARDLGLNVVHAGRIGGAGEGTS